MEPKNTNKDYISLLSECSRLLQKIQGSHCLEKEKSPLKNEGPVQVHGEFKYCDCCGTEITKQKLYRIDSGQLICERCLEELRKANQHLISNN